MSYINYEILAHKNLSLHELSVLQLIKQNRIEPLSEKIKFEVSNTQIIEKFSNLGYIEWIKGSVKDDEFTKIRATKKGTDILEDIGTPEVNTDDLKLYEWLEKVYRSLGKEVGNKRKCKNFIAQFRANSGICRNELAFLCHTFINDEKEIEFSQKLEFLFFKGANLFSVRFDIYQSRLYQYYEKNREYFQEEFTRISQTENKKI